MMTRTMEPALALIRHFGLFAALLAALAWGVVCGVLRAPYLADLAGGLAAAALGFWLERTHLVTPETRARRDFRLILFAGYGFFAVIGVGIVSLASLAARWWLPQI